MKKLILSLIAALALVVGLVAPANAQTGWPSDFNVTNGSVVYDSVFGGNVMNLPPSAFNNGYSDTWAGSLTTGWAGRTLVVCVTGRSPNGGISITSQGFGSAVNFGGFTTNNPQQFCAYVYNNPGANGRVYIRAYSAYNTKVRAVDIYPA